MGEPSPPRGAGEFVMAGRGVPLPEAAMQFFVEAMRANTDVLKSVGENMKTLQKEQREQLSLITDVRERVIKIEAQPKMERELRLLYDRIAILERANAHEDGRAATWAWIGKYFPALATIIFSMIAAVYIIMAASGHLTPPAQSETDQLHQAISAEQSAPHPIPKQ